MTIGSSWRFLPAPALLLVAGSASLLIAVTSFDPNRNPHAHFGEAGNCPRCHVIVAGKPDPDRFLAESVEFCMECHSGEQLGRSHPIRVRTRDNYWKMKVPDDLRMDDDGRMMCLTCHTAHGPFLSTVKAFSAQKPENPNAAGTPIYYRTLFARRSDPKKGFAVLCDGCHKYL